MSGFYFLHRESGEDRTVDDPAAWLIQNADEPGRERARQRVVLNPRDPERLIRVALRRCGLALVHLVCEVRVVVHCWGEPPDLRPFFRRYGLARPAVQVAVRNVKTGKLVVQPGSDYLYGDPIGLGFPWGNWLERYAGRYTEWADDEEAARVSTTNFLWRHAGPSFIPWRVLKAIWGRDRVPCPNCDQTLTVVAVSWHQGPLSYRPGKVARLCSLCCRGFSSDLHDPLSWLAATLQHELRPVGLESWRNFGIDWAASPPRLV